MPHEPFEDFPYDAIDGEKAEEPSDTRGLSALLKRVFKILDKGNTQKGVMIRYQALKYLILQQDQPGLAKELGVTKAAISKVARQMADELGITHHNMRSEETCQKFAEETRKRHEIRKAMQLNPNLLRKV